MNNRTNQKDEPKLCEWAGSDLIWPRQKVSCQSLATYALVHIDPEHQFTHYSCTEHYVIVMGRYLANQYNDKTLEIREIYANAGKS